jgi:hypothetical protein
MMEVEHERDLSVWPPAVQVEAMTSRDVPNALLRVALLLGPSVEK